MLARDLMMRARVWRLLRGYRHGQPAADLVTVALTLVKLSQRPADLSEVAALRINPLLAGATGVLAPGAAIQMQPPLPPRPRASPSALSAASGAAPGAARRAQGRAAAGPARRAGDPRMLQRAQRGCPAALLQRPAQLSATVAARPRSTTIAVALVAEAERMGDR